MASSCKTVPEWPYSVLRRQPWPLHPWLKSRAHEDPMAGPGASLPGLQCGGPCHRVVLSPLWVSFTHMQMLCSVARPKDRSTEVLSWGAPRSMASLVAASSRLGPSYAPSSTESLRTCTLGLAGHPEAARGGGRAAEDLGDPGCEAGEGAQRRSRYRRQVWEWHWPCMVGRTKSPHHLLGTGQHRHTVLSPLPYAFIFN